MEYTYTVLKCSPRHKFLSVRYSAEGKDNFFKNFNPVSFTPEDIKATITEYFPVVKNHWEYQETVNENDPTLAPGHEETVTYAEPEPFVPTDEQMSASVRGERNYRLLETDWMMLSDSSSPSQAWLDYRQALRDITSQSGFPSNVVWPTKPE